MQYELILAFHFPVRVLRDQSQQGLEGQKAQVLVFRGDKIGEALKGEQQQVAVVRHSGHDGVDTFDQHRRARVVAARQDVSKGVVELFREPRLGGRQNPKQPDDPDGHPRGAVALEQVEQLRRQRQNRAWRLDCKLAQDLDSDSLDLLGSRKKERKKEEEKNKPNPAESQDGG